jgi:hypothetical protein
MKVLLGVVLLGLSFSVLAEQARVACSNMFGQVVVRNGQCMYGEEMVKVMENQSVTGSNRVYGSSNARVACGNSFGQVVVRNGQCMFGESLVKVLE